MPSPWRCQPRWSSTSPTSTGFGSASGMTQVFLDLGAEGRQAPVVDDVLEPRPLAVGAIAEVAEDLQHRLADLPHVGPVDVAERNGQERERLLALGVVPRPPPTRTLYPTSRPSSTTRQVAQVVGVDVGAVILGQREGRLELAREIGLAVESARPDRRRRWGPATAPAGGSDLDLLAVQPDLPVARGPRGAVRSPALGVGMKAVAHRSRRAEPGSRARCARRRRRPPGSTAGLSLIRRIVVLRSSFKTPWSWNSCRVVIRRLPLPMVRARWSQARY